ncbi:hypothetical protein BDV37DRAFT_262172 [Aspergillus pseudonomiae]|uniref:Uncharacterized protein n=1 Tax=Aspergillus pseudonomiae TaxID=1506151 RepID=A0A5N7CXG6_9EURO|nr:uncharacterized protein BDV37DRAFT_262172 [Aspergillus pseudonomiae]KAE8398861.1 hypothetical protein BDV37DRAFT_262172 [Aspergillus pseudonomiae]
MPSLQGDALLPDCCANKCHEYRQYRPIFARFPYREPSLRYGHHCHSCCVYN